MSGFEFKNATTVDEAVAILAEHGERARVIAGGTNVMVDIRSKKWKDILLVNIRDIKEMKGISMKDGVITVGALTTLYEISQSELLKEHAPALYMASHVFADPTTCHTATIGGNNANASPDADTSSPLVVLNANVHVKSVNGERVISIDEYFMGVRKTALQPGEIILSFSFAPAKCAFYKLGSRKSMSISVVSAAAAVEMNSDETVKSCRISLGSVGPKNTRALNAEKAMIGKKLNEETYKAMGEALQKDISPRAGSIRANPEYRRQVAPVCVKRAINHAVYGECE